MGALSQSRRGITNTSQTRPHSYLFMVRVWAEELGDDQWEWRGQVRHVISGETRYFRDWAALVDCLLVILTKPTDEEGSIGIK